MKKRIFILLFGILVSSGVFSETIVFRADAMTGNAGSKTDTTTLSGNAFVQTQTMEIKADVIELSGDDFRYITAEGAVEGKNTESNLDFTCGKLKYDRTTKLAVLEDSVSLKDVENDVSADAQIIEYDQNTETAVMQINITIKQKDNTCTSAFAVYRKGEQILEMTGNPKIVQNKDSFQAQEITLNLESQEITLDGRVRGTVTDSKPAQETAQAEKTPEESNQEETAAEQEAERQDAEQTENAGSTAFAAEENQNGN